MSAWQDERSTPDKWGSRENLRSAQLLTWQPGRMWGHQHFKARVVGVMDYLEALEPSKQLMVEIDHS